MSIVWVDRLHSNPTLYHADLVLLRDAIAQLRLPINSELIAKYKKLDRRFELSMGRIEGKAKKLDKQFEVPF